MKRLACLAVLTGLTMPGAATGPKVNGTVKPDGPSKDTRQFVFMRPKLVVPPKLLDGDTIRAVLFPLQTYAGQVADRIKWHRRMLENGGNGHPRGPYWPLLD